MVKIFNARTMAEKKVNERQVTVVDMFKGNAAQNLDGKGAESIGRLSIVPSHANYNGTEAEAKVMADIEVLQGMSKANAEAKLSAEDRKKLNAAQNPGQTAIEALIGAVYMDITRRNQEGGDLTSQFATEMNDANADATVRVNQFYKYVGKMKTVSGSNDNVPLIEQKLGETDNFDLDIKAVGWKGSLKNLLFNKVYDVAKVNQAASDADVDDRNSAIIGTIVNTTFTTLQSQAADTTTDATHDVLMYNTLRKAIKALRALKDPQTDRKIAVPKIAILCNSYDTWDIQRVINGQLMNGGGTGAISTVNATALPIAEIVEYDQGITDGYVYGGETLDFPGVTAGTCYMFVPKEYLYVMNKRGLTLETGMGSVLQLSQEEKAWYRVYGAYFKDFLGSSFSGTSLDDGYGAIVKVTLPTDA